MASQDNISVHQFHSGSAVADAVTNCMFFVQSMLRGFGFASEIFVEHLDPALSGRLQRLEELKIGEHSIRSSCIVLGWLMCHVGITKTLGRRKRTNPGPTAS